MKYLLIAILFISCRQYNYTTDGRKYWIKETCKESHVQPKTGYHWGWNWIHSKYEFHWQYQCFSSCKETVCDKTIYDTIFVTP